MIERHGLVQIGGILGCRCGNWHFILPEDQTFTAALKSYAEHRPELANAVTMLYFWQSSSGTNFTSLLFVLIQKSDPDNRDRLRLGFPLEVEAIEVWSASPSSSDFFEAWGIDAYARTTKP
jgi:hypothetical protein